MKNQKHDEKTVRAYAVLAQLETQYRVRICEHDHTAIVVSGITENNSPPYAGGCIVLECITTRDGSGSSPISENINTIGAATAAP